MLMIVGQSVNGIPFEGPCKVTDRKGSSRYHTPYSVLETKRKYYDIFVRKNKKISLTRIPTREQLLVYLWSAKSNLIFHGRREAITTVECKYHMKHGIIIDADVVMKINLEKPLTYKVKNVLSKTLWEVDAALDIFQSDNIGQMIQDTVIRLMYQHVRLELQYMICGGNYAVGDTVMFSHKNYDGPFINIYDDPDPDEEEMENRRRYAGALRKFHEEMHAFIPAWQLLGTSPEAPSPSESESSNQDSEFSKDENRTLQDDTTRFTDEQCAVPDIWAEDQATTEDIAWNSNTSDSGRCSQHGSLKTVDEEDRAELQVAIADESKDESSPLLNVAPLSPVNSNARKDDVIRPFKMPAVSEVIEDVVSSVVNGIPGSVFNPTNHDPSKSIHDTSHENEIVRSFSDLDTCSKRRKLSRYKVRAQIQDPLKFEESSYRAYDSNLYKDDCRASSSGRSAEKDLKDEDTGHFHYWLQLSRECLKTYLQDNRRNKRPPLFSGFVVSSTPMDQYAINFAFSRYTLVQRKRLKNPIRTYVIYKRYRKTDIYKLSDANYIPIQDPGDDYMYVPHIFRANVDDISDFCTKFLWSPFCFKGRHKYKWDGSFDIEQMKAPNAKNTYIYGMIESGAKEFG